MPILKTCYKCRKVVDRDKPHKCVSKSKDIGADSRAVRSVWTSKKWLRLREYVYDTYGSSGCSRCGSMDNIQLHHIVKVREDITKAYDIENVCLLCSKCHTYIDNNCKSGTLDFKFDKYCYNYTI